MAISNKAKGAILGIIISGVILFLLVFRLEWSELQTQLSKINLYYVLPSAMLILLSFWIRALRWKFLIPDAKEIPVISLFQATLVGTLSSFILPLRAGEFVRPYVLSLWHPVAFSRAFASVVSERVFDVLALLCLLGISISQIPQAPTLVIVGAKALAIIAILIGAFMMLCYAQDARMKKFIKTVLSLTVEKKSLSLSLKIENAVNEGIEGFKAIRSFKDLVIVIVLSFALWGEVTIHYQMGLWMLGEFPSWWVGLIVNLMIALAVAAPSAPGFLGTFQLGCVVALSIIFPYSEEFAVAYSVVSHFIQTAVVLLSGAFVLYIRGLAISEITKK